MFLFQSTTQANILISPYYRYFLPHKDNNEPFRIVDTITYHDERVVLVTNDRSHQFGIQIEKLKNKKPIQTSSMRVQMIDRRPFTARSSISDDGLIFQYWQKYSPSEPFTVLFGYTTDRNIAHVRLKLENDSRQLKVYDGRYFFCTLNPATDHLIEAQGIGMDGNILRTWNGQWDYAARRTWLSFFVQSYPYIVS